MICPCCGFNPDDKSALAYVRRCRFTPLERRLYEAMARRFNVELSSEYLIDAVWADDPNGGPATASNVIAVAVSKVRKKIAPHGLVIEGKLGEGGWRKLRWATQNERAASK